MNLNSLIDHTNSSSWGGTLKRESWDIWYLLHCRIRMIQSAATKCSICTFIGNTETEKYWLTWLYSPLPVWKASPPPPRPPPKDLWRHCPCSGGLWPLGQMWPQCTFDTLFLNRVIDWRGTVPRIPSLWQTIIQCESATSSTLHLPVAQAADLTLLNCFPPRLRDLTYGCRSPPWKETWMMIFDKSRGCLNLMIDAVKSIWSTRAVTMEKGDACPSA